MSPRETSDQRGFVAALHRQKSVNAKSILGLETNDSNFINVPITIIASSSVMLSKCYFSLEIDLLFRARSSFDTKSAIIGLKGPFCLKKKCYF